MRKPADSKNPWGYFIGTVKAKWLADGRSMELLDKFVYVDRRGKQWIAGEGDIINGASIPWVFRRLFPCYIGGYRWASVLHDPYCDMGQRYDEWETQDPADEPYPTSKEVHWMFFEAIMAKHPRHFERAKTWIGRHIAADRDRLYTVKAWLMWLAVRTFGPKF